MKNNNKKPGAVAHTQRVKEWRKLKYKEENKKKTKKLNVWTKSTTMLFAKDKMNSTKNLMNNNEMLRMIE